MQISTHGAAGAGPASGMYKSNSAWIVSSRQTYAGVAQNLFVFDTDKEGRATSLSPAEVCVTLTRKGE